LDFCIFGFQDESHNNIDENKMKIYYPLGTKNIRYKTRKRITTSIMGFQAVNGKSIAYFPERSITYFFLDFLLRVRLANTDNPHIIAKIINIINDNYHSKEVVLQELKRRNPKDHLNNFVDNYIEYMKINYLNEEMSIIMVLDNCKIHKSNISLEVSQALNIDLRFLPKYSPQFNPIEQVWRSIKREISYHIIKSKKQLQKTIYKEYMNIINNKTYFKNWLEKYTKYKYQI